MLFFRNNTTVLLFLSRVRTPQSTITNAVDLVRTVLGLPLGCANMFLLQVHF